MTNMGDSDQSVHRREDPSPYKKIVVNPIEKDRKTKEEPDPNFKNATRPQFFAVLVHHLKKMLSFLSFKGKGLTFFFNQRTLLNDILAFKNMLLLLSAEDESHNPSFIQKLTELWHKLLDDCNSLSYSLQGSSEFLTKLNFFLSQVQNYPLGADHTLGYYFTEYVGKEWTPFPFMELLQTLHEDFQAHSTQSILSDWISLLDEILGPLLPKEGS